MKSILIISALMLFVSPSLAESSRDQFNQRPQNSGNREKVEAIAQEQGIDLSSEEGKHSMAQYLMESGQGNLLPPRRERGGMGGQQQFDGSNQSNGSDNSNKRGGQRPQRAMGQSSAGS